jgi:hypothetical protein
MFYRSNIGKNLIFGVCGIVLIILVSPISVQSQIEGIISHFLLNESEMINYKLISQFRNDWIIGEGNQLHKSIRQTWINEGTNKVKEITVDICVFNSLPEAIHGTAYSAGTYEDLFLWGSNSGATLGDGSWINASLSGRTTTILVRGNVGAHIGFLLAKEHEKRDLETIVYNVLTKIEENLSQEILSAEEAMKQKMGAFEEYQTITEPVINSEIMNGFAFFNKWDSKWLIEFSSLAMGIQKEWKNEHGSLVGINICKFDTDSIAAKAANTKSRMTYSSVFNINNLGSLKSILSEWQNTWQYSLTKNLFSVVGVKDNFAVHVYQFDPTGIDINFFYSIVEKLSRSLK